MFAARLKNVVVGAITVLLASGPCWAAPGGERGPNPRAPGIAKKAPEIDASSGASAIAILTGVILLLRERFRSRS